MDRQNSNTQPLSSGITTTTTPTGVTTTISHPGNATMAVTMSFKSGNDAFRQRSTLKTTAIHAKHFAKRTTTTAAELTDRHAAMIFLAHHGTGRGRDDPRGDQDDQELIPISSRPGRPQTGWRPGPEVRKIVQEQPAN